MKLSIAYIRLLTLIYISFPLLPFFGGWVKLEFGIPLIGLLVWGIYRYVKGQNFQEKEFFSKRDLWIGFAIIAVWVLFSGAGGMGYQFSDHVKNNTLTKELSALDWPISYEVDGAKMYLGHYLSFYIVGPFVAGFMGYKYAQLAVFLWTALGTFLGVFWLARGTKWFNWRFFLFFILFGGISIFSFILKYKLEFIQEIIQRTNDHGLVHWMNSWDVIPLNYLHITDMLYWTPQHMIPAFLGIGILLNDGFIDKNVRYTPFVLSLLAMWSPLILVGIAPFFIYVLFQQKWKGVFNYVNLIIAPIIFFVVASFLLSIKAEDLVQHFIFKYKSEAGYSVLAMVGVFAYFVFFEVLIWLIPIYWIMRNKWIASQKNLFYVLLSVLLLVPLYRMGVWNDWSNRVSMPGIVLMSVLAYQAFMNSSGISKKVVLSLLVLASLGPLIDIVGSAKESNFIPKFSPPLEHQVQTLPEICESLGYPIEQFVAPEDAFFFKYLAKRP